MVRIYIASNRSARARKVMDALRSNGHEIVYDWTENYDEHDSAQKAIAERDAIRRADLLVLLWHPDAESARFEAGMAMGLGKQVIVAGAPDSFFYNLPDITRVSADDEVVNAVMTWSFRHRPRTWKGQNYEYLIKQPV